MSLWTSSVIAILLLQTVQPQAQQINEDNSKPVTVAEVSVAPEDLPRTPVVAKKSWTLTQAYADVFKILSSRNSCSDFYGGPRAATTVLNDFFMLVESRELFLEVSFQMVGKPRMIYDHSARVFYRLFDTTLVNTNGSFYRRRLDAMRKVPFDVGSFRPGTRQARALILLHELGHLIQGQNGTWLIPDDGFDFRQSHANSLRIQEVCRAELETLK
jgi:hypothetical protein